MPQSLRVPETSAPVQAQKWVLTVPLILSTSIVVVETNITIFCISVSFGINLWESKIQPRLTELGSFSMSFFLSASYCSFTEKISQARYRWEVDPIFFTAPARQFFLEIVGVRIDGLQMGVYTTIQTYWMYRSFVVCCVEPDTLLVPWLGKATDSSKWTPIVQIHRRNSWNQYLGTGR